MHVSRSFTRLHLPVHRRLRTTLPRASLSADLPDPRSLKPNNVALDLGVDILASTRMLQPHERLKLDAQPDAAFYSQPCSTHHTDERFQALLTSLYLSVLQPGWRVLDLCSSFNSFLPCSQHMALGPVTGLGLNQQELGRNTALTSFLVHDLNQSPKLPFPTGSQDAVLCCCGLPYLEQPEAIMLESLRVLSQGGVFMASFSTQCYPEKAIVGWLERNAWQRVLLVANILRQAGFNRIELLVCPAAQALLRAQQRDASAPAFLTTTTVLQPTSSSLASEGEPEERSSQRPDPFFAVLARKAALPLGRDATGLSSGQPEDWAERYTSPALREIELLLSEQATQQLSETGPSVCQSREADVQAAQDETVISAETLDRWRVAFAEMSSEAVTLGIPLEAIPKLPHGRCSVQQIREARDHLQGMIASFLSSGL